MSASNDFINDLAKHICQNADIANIGDAGGLQNSTADGSLFVALHTDDPGAGNKQNSNEATFTGYSRQAVSRAGAAGWTVSGGTADNTAAITYTECSGGSETITHFSIGYETSGATKYIAAGTLTTPRAVSTGVTLSFAIGDCNLVFS